jgi:RecG-like helicase
MRGAGDLLGTRQSGYGAIEFARLMDARLVDLVRREAWAIYESDPALSQPEHAPLRERIETASAEFGDVS